MNYYIVKYMSVIHLVPKLNLGTRGTMKEWGAYPATYMCFDIFVI